MMHEQQVISLYSQLDPAPLWDNPYCRAHKILSAQAGSLYQGNVICIQIKLNNQHIIEDTRGAVYGQATTIAAMAYLKTWLMHKPHDALQTFSYDTLVEQLNLNDHNQYGAILAMEVIEQLQTAKTG